MKLKTIEASSDRFRPFSSLVKIVKRAVGLVGFFFNQLFLGFSGFGMPGPAQCTGWSGWVCARYSPSFLTENLNNQHR